LKDPWEVVHMARKRVFVEFSEMRDPEALAEIAEVAEKLIKSAETDAEKSYAMGVLAMSTNVLKKWRFGFDEKARKPFVEVEYIFDKVEAAEMLWTALKAVGVNARKRVTEINGNKLPAVLVDWKQYRELISKLGGPIMPLDVVAADFIMQESVKTAIDVLVKYSVFMILLGVANEIEI